MSLDEPCRPRRPSGPEACRSAAPDALFVYGSLRFPEVLAALLDRVPLWTPARVDGWRAAALPGLVYPGLVPADSMAVGLLLTGLTGRERRLLDAFEGPAYDLRSLALADGRYGWAYVYRSEAEVLPVSWSADEFVERDLTAYVEDCTAWRRHHEAEGLA